MSDKINIRFSALFVSPLTKNPITISKNDTFTKLWEEINKIDENNILFIELFFNKKRLPPFYHEYSSFKLSDFDITEDSNIYIFCNIIDSKIKNIPIENPHLKRGTLHS